MSGIFTIGHSNLPPDMLIRLLQEHNIQVVVDVRSVPFSRSMPHCNKRNLQDLLQGNNIRYLYLGNSMGGKPGGPLYRDIHGNIDYEIIAAAAEFQTGIKRLLNGMLAGWRIALFCAEEDPQKCHRHLLIAKELVYRWDIPVSHIRADGRLVDALELFTGNPDQMSLF
jgi:uncharacterized protein (DUF488 family)